MTKKNKCVTINETFYFVEESGLMEKGKFVAYVSTYTMGKGDKHGIKIYDVDMENGRLQAKDQVEITNSSYVTISHNKKCLYSITEDRKSVV